MTKYFTEDHEWLLLDGVIATIGITSHAADLLGDIVFIELKDSGETFDKGDEIGVVESVKAASEIYAPVSGEIIESNEELADNPALVNQSAEETGYLYKIKISNPEELEGLMNLEAYKALID